MMRNRAKCKLCKSVIESRFNGDYVVCSCGEIGIDGGEEKYAVSARDYSNFLRIDDEDNEIEVKVIGEEQQGRPTREELIGSLGEMIKRIEELPKHAMLTNINHYDWCSLLILLHSIFLLEDRDGK